MDGQRWSASRVITNVVLGLSSVLWWWLFASADQWWRAGSSDHTGVPLAFPAFGLAVLAFYRGAFTHKSKHQFVLAEVLIMGGALWGVFDLLGTIGRRHELWSMVYLAAMSWMAGYLVHDLIERSTSRKFRF